MRAMPFRIFCVVVAAGTAGFMDLHPRESTARGRWERMSRSPPRRDTPSRRARREGDIVICANALAHASPPNHEPREQRMGRLKTSLGIWAFGSMVTRFMPVGYQPDAHGRDHGREGAPRGHGARRPDRRLRVPLPGRALARRTSTRCARRSTATPSTRICAGLHLDPRFGRGGLVNPDPATRAEALRLTLEGADFAGSLGAHFVLWPGIEGYNYPFQTPYAESWGWFIEAVGQAAEVCAKHGRKLFLEHKNSEPAMKILMRNIGMTLHVIHKLRVEGITNVQVNMDWQHLIMNGESLGEYAAMLAGEGLLGHQHANSGWGTFDDDNMVGATAFMETLELALELRRADYGANGERLGFDLYPYTEDAVDVVRRSVLQWDFIDAAAGRIDEAALREAQSRKDAIKAYELVYAALGAVAARLLSA